jgi:hypothetical protein
MKKFGVFIFIVAILVGVAFANLFSFGHATEKVFDFSFVTSVRGSGSVVSEVRSVSDFTAIDVGGVFEVEVSIGKDYSVEVLADDNLLQHIKTEVHAGVLNIETTRSIKSRNPFRVRVSAPSITNVDASGASKVAVDGIRNSNFDIDSSGASKISLSGETSSLQVDVSGASHIDAENLKAETAAVDASGASKVTLFVTGRLTSAASGASRIVYSGSPSSVQKKTSGASSVRAK